MDKHILKAEKRKVVGRKVKNLRLADILPANIYGKKIDSLAVQVKKDELIKVYKEVGETGIVELDVDGAKKPVLIHKLQIDPQTDAPIHADFLQIDLKEKVTANIPVELTGESPAGKQSLVTVVLYINQIEVTALPTDLPEKFIVDAGALIEVNQAVHIKDLAFDKAKVEISADVETIVAKVEPPQKEEVVAPPVPAEGEVPLEGAVPAEGEVPAEGAQPSPEGQGEPQKEEPKE